jgi:hypothetical protein
MVEMKSYQHQLYLRDLKQIAEMKYNQWVELPDD